MESKSLLELQKEYISPFRGVYATDDETAEKHGFRVVGSGSESVVVEPQKRFLSRMVGAINTLIGRRVNDSVIALDTFPYPPSPNRAKRIYFSQKIAATLFPHNFPNFSFSWSGETSGTVRQKVSTIRKLGSNNLENLDKKAKYPFQDVIDTMAKFGIRIEGFLDNYVDNFELSKEGGVCYMDRFAFGNISPKVAGAIKCYMQEHEYSEREVRAVEMSIKRLNVLADQMKAQRAVQDK